MTNIKPLMSRLGAKDDFDFSRKLIVQYKVATVPGFSFFSEKNPITGFVRFTFCKKEETLEKVSKLLYAIK